MGIVILTFSTAYLVWGQSTKIVSETSDSLYFESPALFECNVQFPVNYNSE